jgi:hypothetical protein
MEPTSSRPFTPDDTIPETLLREIESHTRDTIPCPPPPSSLAPVSIDLADEALDEE